MVHHGDMRLSPTHWVPSGAWLAPGYAEWAPPTALRGEVACLWASFTPQDDQAGQPRLVLPDGCSDLIWERGVGAYIAGPDTGPVRPLTKPGTAVVGIRFRPSAGGRVLKTPLSEIMNQRVPLADLLPTARSQLPATLDPAEAADRMLSITGALVAEGAQDPAMAQAATLLRNPAARTEAVAATVRSQDAAARAPLPALRPAARRRLRAARPGRRRRPGRLRRPGPPHPRMLRPVRPHPRQPGPCPPPRARRRKIINPSVAQAAAPPPAPPR
jgi:hypothetical protein